MNSLSFLYVSGYQFSAMKNLVELRSWLLDSAVSDVKGTILLAEEGVNFSLCGPSIALEKYYRNMAEKIGLVCAIRKSYAAYSGFRRFMVKIKSEIVAYRCPHAQHQPLPYLSAEDFHRWLGMGCDFSGRPLCLIDVRNAFEYKIGTFYGAINVPTKSFNEFHVRMSREFIRENSSVVIFCTGGVRCEKASYWFQRAGIPAFQLDGGILKYMETFGQGFFDGSCFVFDERVSLNGSLIATNPCC